MRSRMGALHILECSIGRKERYERSIYVGRI